MDLVRTHCFPARLSKTEADALNRESGRIYSETLVWHYRVYRRKGIWLSQYAGMRLNDYVSGSTTLHAHSRDAAQEAFYKACKTAKAAGTRYPHKRKQYRTTIWKKTGIRLRDGKLLLARARGLPPVVVSLPPNLTGLPVEAFLEVRLVWNHAAQHYDWHVVIEDGGSPAEKPGDRAATIDLGEVHPGTATDGEEAVVFSARQLRSVRQYTHKRLAEIRSRQDRLQKGSRRWRKLQRRKARFLAKQRRRVRDIEHKLSRAVVHWAVERRVGTLVIGDVRDVADGKRLCTREQQKISSWSHGQLRAYITYKAQAAGIEIKLIEEHYTSQTCPRCGQRHKPQGRIYKCPACGFAGHRDVVGAANILSRFVHGELGKVWPSSIKYRHPFLTGKRSRLDAAKLARGGNLRGSP